MLRIRTVGELQDAIAGLDRDQPLNISQDRGGALVPPLTEELFDVTAVEQYDTGVRILFDTAEEEVAADDE